VGVAADQATPKWDPGARPEPRTVVRPTVSGRRYPIWGRPGLLLWVLPGASASRRKLVACGSEKQRSKAENNLTHFGHPCKTAARASLRSDNCPTIPDECPTIIGSLSDNFGLDVRNHRNAQLGAVRLYVNYFQPSFKLKERIREGAKIKKSYYPPATPCDRLLAHEKVEETVKATLRKQRELLDPVELLHRIRQGQSALAALTTGKPSDGPSRKSLDQFLAGLPQLWRAGEARPTHRKEEPKARYWRTRADPFKDVWTDILLWLQKEPDCIAKVMLQRLDEKYPGQFGGKLLRTLQRRVGEWRRTMARRLVLGGVEEWNGVQAVAANVPLAGQMRQLVSTCKD
jgi:hypothetical protein